jgi:hypothetical protein
VAHAIQSIVAWSLFAAYSFGQSTSKPTVDRTAFTFTSYDLRVSVDRAQHSLSCRGRITLRNDSKSPQPKAAMQLSSSLKWASVRGRSGEPLRFAVSRLESDVDHTGSVNEAIVDLAEPVQPGGTVELEIGYTGTITLDTARLDRIGTPAQAARSNDWDRISIEFTGVRGVGNVAWYPVALEPVLLGEGRRVLAALEVFKARHQESTARIEITVAPVPGGAAGVLIGNGKFRGGSSSFTLEFPRFGLETPLFLIADYKSFDVANGRVWYLPQRESDAQRHAMDLAKLKPLVDSPLRQKVELVQLPDGAANYESGSMFLLPLIETNEKQLAQLLIHTVTHAAVDSPRPWIYEGLAHYAQALVVEEQFGRNGALQFLEQRRAALALAESPEGNGRGLIQAEKEIFYRTKAMYVWWMLRDLVGEQVLRSALEKYRAAQDKEPSYLQRLVEAESKRNLESFFDDWVYRDRGLPEFRVTNVYVRQNLRGGYLSTVTVENTGNAGADVQVTLRAKAVSNGERLYVAGKEKASIRIELPLTPEEASVNDGSVPETDISNNVYVVPVPAK